MSAKISETKVLTNNIGPSYVSSNGYYGYVPPIGHQFTQNPNISLNNPSGVCVQENQQSVFTMNGGVLEGRPVHHYQQDYYSDNTTMEMDTDDCSGMGMCCQNNHYVIPEMVNGGKVVDYSSMTYHQTNGNRKRQIHCGRQAGTVKKFKSAGGSRFRGGGNSRVNHGTTSPRDSRSSQVHNDSSSSLYINPHTLTLTWHSMSTDDCCTQAAGKSTNNYHFPDNKIIDYARVRRDRFISGLCGNEYENMLMETHGCSVYHHQRQLEFDNGTVETEF